jgi:hypothetical protein
MCVLIYYVKFCSSFKILASVYCVTDNEFLENKEYFCFFLLLYVKYI